jgi:hypothetical protein
LDLALSCEIEGRPGLVLVEAKAHHAELSTAGNMLDRPIMLGDTQLRVLVRSRPCRAPSPLA